MKKEFQEKNGYRIIKRGKFQSISTRLDCSICKCAFIDEMDQISNSRSGCCLDCEHEVVDPNRANWNNGWRPDQSKINEIMSKRLSSPHSRRHI
jgi:hypothetical protein